jgi:seryl-tRNA synthetase
MFRDVILNENELPVLLQPTHPLPSKQVLTRVRGLNRLHQFDKAVVRIHPDKSYEALDGMVEHIKDILNELKLPYRILRLCGGDMGFIDLYRY